MISMLDRRERVLALRDYQAAGVAFLSESRNALLADEMGLGKTVQVASAIDSLRRNGELKRALVIVPSALRLNWQRELKTWAPHSLTVRVEGPPSQRHALYRVHVPVLIATYGQIRSDAKFLSENIDFDLVVLDEAQNIKNGESKTAHSCFILNRKRSWALSGTPLENRRDDLFSVFRFVKLGLLHEGMDRNGVIQAMQPHFLRRYKEDVLPELPPVIEQELVLEMEGAQLLRYEEILMDVAGNANISNLDYPFGNILALITRLKQICNFDEESNESCKRDVLVPYVRDVIASGKKTIIFSQYVKTLKWLGPQIEELGVRPLIFEGSLDDEKRNEMVDHFNNSPHPEVMLISLKAGGVGLNLDAADYVVLYDRWWNPAVEAQAINRAHRFGRDRVLQVLKFIVSTSIEEKINDILLQKQQLFEEYVEQAEGSEIGGFNRQVLLEILGVEVS